VNRDDYYKDMVPLAIGTIGYGGTYGDVEPDEYEASVWINNTWNSDKEQHGTVISLEGYAGDHEFGFELTMADAICLAEHLTMEISKQLPDDGHDFTVRCSYCLNEPFDVGGIESVCYERGEDDE
jgi:hypothetical protein